MRIIHYRHMVPAPIMAKNLFIFLSPNIILLRDDKKTTITQAMHIFNDNYSLNDLNHIILKTSLKTSCRIKSQ